MTPSKPTYITKEDLLYFRANCDNADEFIDESIAWVPNVGDAYEDVEEDNVIVVYNMEDAYYIDVYCRVSNVKYETWQMPKEN